LTQSRKHIAVLIFALSQEEEIKRKPFLRNTLLQQDLTSHTHNIVKKTGLDYYIYSEQEQVGTNFGERFTNAIKDIYNKGYDAIITLGNDTPNLNKTHLVQAIDTLQQGKSVIGPSFDGGFYLMGLQKKVFEHQDQISDIVRVYKGLPEIFRKLRITLQKLLTEITLKHTYLIKGSSSILIQAYHNKGSPYFSVDIY